MKYATANQRRTLGAGGERQAGISLVEFMVAMALGLLLIGAIGSTYLGNKGAFREARAVSVMQDNGRFALETLTRDIRLAGFSGCVGSASTTSMLTNQTAFLYKFSQGLQGYQGSTASTPTAVWSPVLDSAIGSGATTPLAGTDVLALRRAEGQSYGLNSLMATSSAAPQIDTALLTQEQFQQGQFVLLRDCTAGVIFQVTNTNAATSGQLQHVAGAGSPGNGTADLGRTFNVDAQVTRLVTASYFIAPSVAVPGRKSLWEQVDASAPIELALGVDDMQLLFGEDTDGDQTANRYVTADVVSNMANVVSVRVSLLVSSDDNIAQKSMAYTFNGTTYTPADRRLRSVFTTVVNLRNRTP